MPGSRDEWPKLKWLQKIEIWIRTLLYAAGAVLLRLRWALRRREFWEEVAVLGARPHIIGQVAIGIVALALFPNEFWAGAQAGAAVSAAVEIGKLILNRG